MRIIWACGRIETPVMGRSGRRTITDDSRGWACSLSRLLRRRAVPERRGPQFHNPRENTERRGTLRVGALVDGNLGCDVFRTVAGSERAESRRFTGWLGLRKQSGGLRDT